MRLFGALAGMAAAAFSMAGHTDFFDGERHHDVRPTSPKRRRLAVPNDYGPVIDTTRESKRARRRRLARS